jgi:DNA-binding NarL/FixJ family response regulator
MSKSILIVDDSKAIRSATRSFIESRTKYGICGEAIDGIDAIDKACKLRPDLIILDLGMPRMNGLNAAKEIKKTLAQVPIILFTMYADAVRLQDAQSSGVSAVVSKSDDLSVLARQVETLLV